MAKDKTAQTPALRKGSAWEDALKAVDRALGSRLQGVASATVARLIGFWVLWHLTGGFDGLKAAGWPRSTIWRSRQDFVKVFGVEVEDFLPEMVADIGAWRERPVRGRRG